MFHQPRFPWNKGISLSYLNVRIPKVVVRCFALGRLEISLPRLSCGQWCLCLQDLGHGDQSTGDVFNDAISICGSLKNGGVIAHICSLENDWLFTMSRDPHLRFFWTMSYFQWKAFWHISAGSRTTRCFPACLGCTLATSTKTWRNTTHRIHGTNGIFAYISHTNQPFM